MKNAFRIAAVASLALVAVAASVAGGRKTTDGTRPNVLVLMTDDQTVESMRVMPNVQRLLAARGVTFQNSFVGYSLCCPSRSTFLTGQYSHNNGVMGNTPPEGGYTKLDHANTLAVWLQRAGYATVHLGKYLNGYGQENRTEIPPGWTEWHGSIDPTTYQYYGYTLNEDGRLVTYGRDAASYQTDVYAEKAVEIVGQRAASPQPFFLWVAFLAPHSGGPSTSDRPRGTPLPAPRHGGRYASEPLPLPPSFNEEDVSDKPASIQRRRRLGPAAIDGIAKNYRLRLESLLAVDEAVARIVEALRQAGELDDTLIVFTSDNGFFHGEHRIAQGKILLYEPSIRVPLVVRGPGVPAGVRLSQPVSNIDVAPTILDAADVEPGRVVDGRSLFPLFADTGLNWGRDLLIESGGAGAFTAIRTPRYLYAEHETGEKELYDLAKDPDELQSRHADPAYDAVRAELARRLATLRDCAGAPCRAGPSLELSLRCSGSAVRARLGGADTQAVGSVEFLVSGRKIASDDRAPFEQSFVAARGATVRAVAVLTDGRRVTRDRRATGC